MATTHSTDTTTTLLTLEAALAAARAVDEACHRTGARYDARAQAAHDELDDATQRYERARRPYEARVTQALARAMSSMRHGQCPSGIDTDIARLFWTEYDSAGFVHPAMGDSDCRRHAAYAVALRLSAVQLLALHSTLAA